MLRWPHCGRVVATKKQASPKTKIGCPAWQEAFEADDGLLPPVTGTIPLDGGEPAQPPACQTVTSQPNSWTTGPQSPHRQDIDVNALPEQGKPVATVGLVLGSLATLIGVILCASLFIYWAQPA